MKLLTLVATTALLVGCNEDIDATQDVAAVAVEFASSTGICAVWAYEGPAAPASVLFFHDRDTGNYDAAIVNPTSTAIVATIVCRASGYGPLRVPAQTVVKVCDVAPGDDGSCTARIFAEN